MERDKLARAIEPIAILDALATDIENIEILDDGLRRIVFVAPHLISDDGVEYHVTVKLVVPERALLAILRKLNRHAEETISSGLTLAPNGN